jgi:SAM-dependent methyltransferase
VGRLALRSEDLVIDIGCNDGSLLGAFRGHGVRTLGVDPARNLAELANDLGIERYVGYFGARSAGEICDRWGCAALITTTNTFPHIPDLQDFLSGVLTVLAPGGTFVIESHYLGDLLEQLAFDTIYHEHVSYWALAPMIRLLEDVGMEVVSVEHLPIHHGQLRVSVMRRGEGSVDGSVAERLALEESLGLARFDTFTDFSQRVQRIRGDLHATMDDLKAQGARLAGYGAPAKGSTLLEYLEIGPRTVEYIVDRSPLKQGRFTPGSHIPIVSPERLLTDGPDYVLLMAWNFAEEILEQQAEYRRRGGRFILPIPAVQIL